MRVILISAGGHGALLAEAKNGSQTDLSFWSVESDGFIIRWSTGDLRAARKHSPEKVIFSVRERAIAEFEQYVDDDADTPYQFEKTAILVSVVGPMISIHTTETCDCGGAHPSMVATLETIDLRQRVDDASGVVALTDLFPAADILQALLADSVVRKTLDAQADAKSLSLAQLLDLLAFRSVEINDCSYEFPDDLLNRFAIHHLEANQVAIRLALPHSEEACRQKIAQLGILLPIPEPLRHDLLSAQAERQGFLAQAMPPAVQSHQTSVILYSE